MDTTPLFQMSRCPKTLKKRATLASAVADAERVQAALTEVLASNDITIIDLTKFPGGYHNLVHLLAPLAVNDKIEQIVVPSELTKTSRLSVDAYLTRLFSKTNTGTVTVLGAAVPLSSLVSFQKYTRKIVSPDDSSSYSQTKKRPLTDAVVPSDETTCTDLAKSRKIYALRAKGIRKPDSTNPSPNQEKNSQRCYVCHTKNMVELTMDKPGTSNNPVDFYKNRLCPQCAKFNFDKRSSSVNLDGKYAIITGGRIKIGFKTALKLLRDGCYVVATTRFASDAWTRYEQQPDFGKWKDRLHVYEVDFRDLKGIYTFTSWCKEHLPRLDILINNAAQTIDRPDEFYQHMLEDSKGTSTSSSVVPVADLTDKYFPVGQVDEFGQQVDLRRHNSWKALLQDVPIRELLQVFAINAVAPFILVQELHPIMTKTEGRKFVVNVSAMEGQFSRVSKTERHPHTNMAKAALNMFTRTTGLQLVTDHIYMTAVDTGWVTDERPYHQAEYEQKKGFVVPLDCVDGASRVYDPIVRGLTAKQVPDYAVFLKNYKPHSW